MKVLATILARGGSRGVPNKNIREVGGKPLLWWAIESVHGCELIDDAIISTDSDVIWELAYSYGYGTPYKRPAELATHETSIQAAMIHAVEWVERAHGYSPDIVVNLGVPSPLRLPQDVTGTIETLLADDHLNAVTTIHVSETNPYLNMVERDSVGAGIHMSKEMTSAFTINGAVMAWRRKSLDTVVNIYDGVWGGYVIPRERGIDIDTETDLELRIFNAS
jgi:CMP-N,N'-diacetyllegionaminic acid synthase